MSMSQEEIEALMNGADFEPEKSEEDTPSEEPEEENFDDILAGIDGISEDEPAEEDNFDDILAGIDGVTDDEPSVEETEEENFDDILAGIDGVTDDEPESEEENFDDILAGIDGISEDEVSEPKEEPKAEEEKKYPFPVENEHKVVNQLNEVAEDSEEKASQIFDVLSFILDENNEIQKYNKSMSEFVEKQIELLEMLGTKFPNIEVFSENLESAKKVIDESKQLSNRVDGENNKVFEAMELMQYHDINRQKIERVMAVIRSLSSYLNGIFQDDSDKPEVQIAKHISGDGTNTVGSDDLEDLISQFGNEG